MWKVIGHLKLKDSDSHNPVGNYFGEYDKRENAEAAAVALCARPDIGSVRIIEEEDDDKQT